MKYQQFEAGFIFADIRELLCDEDHTVCGNEGGAITSRTQAITVFSAISRHCSWEEAREGGRGGGGLSTAPSFRQRRMNIVHEEIQPTLSVIQDKSFSVYLYGLVAHHT
jgi:hypothetical protein